MSKIQSEYPLILPYSVYPMDTSGSRLYYLILFDSGAQLKVSDKILKILTYLDGTHSYSEICKSLRTEHGISICEEELRFLIETRLSTAGAFYSGAKDEPRSSNYHSAIMFRTTFIQGIHFKALTVPFQFLFSVHYALAMILIALLSVLYHLTNYRAADYMDPLSTMTGMSFAVILALLSIVFHEFGHITAAFRFGIVPRDIGVGLYLLMPSLFVDLREAWRLPRKQRVIIDLAGVYFQLILFILFEIMYWISNENVFLLANQFILVSVCVNLNPILRYDGFWAVTDALGIVNFHSKAFEVIKSHWFYFILRKRSYRDRLDRPFRDMQVNRRKVLIKFSFVYWITVITATTYIIHTMISALFSGPFLDWESKKGLIVVLGIALVNAVFRYVVKRQSQRRSEKRASKGSDESHTVDQNI
ncbi:hypothetical protein [Paenibacillus sp. YYML68]|uniref:hypothetical protein n=1 Tax=Paenibacillus sp. YYML68 TaxID=2909250 RepID=UPI002493A42D|nr:hypothetical protein [Paenibacillus sp. YYML68]